MLLHLVLVPRPTFLRFNNLSPPKAVLISKAATSAKWPHLHRIEAIHAVAAAQRQIRHKPLED
jgi:hypothetical protein